MKIEQETTNLVRAQAMAPKNFFIAESQLLHVIASISNQRSTSFHHPLGKTLIIFLKQQTTADITPRSVNPPYITVRRTLNKLV